MTLAETINKYDETYHLLVFDKGIKLKFYEIYNDEAFKREVSSEKKIGKDVYINLK